MKSCRQCLIACFAASTLVPSLAFAQTGAAVASVDDVLSAVAEVVKDRAKAVGARTAKREIIGKICSASKFVINKDKKTEILFGGKECRNTPEGCNEEDYFFVNTCRLAIDRDLDLTDPHLLKTLSQDVVKFALRVAAAGSDAARAKLLGISAVSVLVFGVLEIRTDPEGTLDEVVDLLLGAANKIRPPEMDAVPLQQAAGSVTLRGHISRLDAELRTKFGAAPDNCVSKLLSEEALQGTIADPKPALACVMSHMPSVAAVVPEAGSAEDAKEIEDCSDFLSRIPERDRLFRALFKRRVPPPSLGDPLKPGCTGVTPNTKHEQCEQAFLALNLSSFLHKAICHQQLGDPRRELRALLAIYEQELKSNYQIHDRALKNLFKNETETFFGT